MEYFEVYTEENTNFTFLYPPTWSIDPKDPLQLTTTRSSTQSASGDFTTGMAWIQVIINKNSIINMIQALGSVDTKEQITLDGNPATKVTGSTGVAGTVTYTAIITIKSNTTNTLKLTTQDEQLLPIVKSEFDQILSTFKFTQ